MATGSAEPLSTTVSRIVQELDVDHEQISLLLQVEFEHGHYQYSLSVEDDGDDGQFRFKRFNPHKSTSMRPHDFAALTAAVRELRDRGYDVDLGPVLLPDSLVDDLQEAPEECFDDVDDDADDDGDGDDHGSTGTEASDEQSSSDRSEDPPSDQSSDVDNGGDEALQQLGEEAPLDHTDPEDLQRAYDATETITDAAEFFEVEYTTVFRRLKEFEIHVPGSVQQDVDESAATDAGEEDPSPTEETAPSSDGDDSSHVLAALDLDPNDVVDALASAHSVRDVQRSLGIVDAEDARTLVGQLGLIGDLTPPNAGVDRATAEQAVQEAGSA